MSWGVSYSGRNSLVAARVEEELSRYKCEEPEESAKQAFIETVKAFAAVYPNGFSEVSGNGSMSWSEVDDAGKPKNPLNLLTISIKPLYLLI